ncbi:hypothetical protein Tco_1116548, partial [Tanacetum coccineum]
GILSCPHHDKTEARQEAGTLPGTGRGVVEGALLATKMVVAAKALATKMGVKAKARWNKGNWLAIQRQLLQLERQQSHLMNTLQVKLEETKMGVRISWVDHMMTW